MQGIRMKYNESPEVFIHFFNSWWKVKIGNSAMNWLFIKNQSVNEKIVNEKVEIALKKLNIP